MTSAFEARLIRIEQSRPMTAASLSSSDRAREQLAALVHVHGGQLPGESLAGATARILGISTRELIADLKQRAGGQQ